MSTLNYTDIVNIINGGGVVFLDCGGVPKLIDSIPDIPPDLTICGFVERNLSEYVIVGSPANGQIPAYNSTTSKLQWTTPASGGGAWGTITGTLSNQTDLQTALNLKASINTTDGIIPYKSGSGTLADSPITRIDASTIQVAAINGGSGANDDIIIQGTSNATRTTSYVNLQPNGGNVGIGTTAPDAQLTINSQDVARPSLKIRALAGTASTQNVFESYNSSGTLTSYIQDNGASYFGNGLIVNNGIVTISNGSASKLMVSNTDCRLASDSQIGWSSSTTATSANADTAFVRATVKVASLTDGSTGGATLRTVPDSPTQLTADQNNYQAGTGRSMFYRLSSDASRSITGFNPAGGTNQDGELHYFINVGSNNIVLVNESASSTAGNRFLNVTGADITLAANEMAMLVYDNTSARWRVAKM